VRIDGGPTGVRSGGFSLVEVICALFILGVCVAGVTEGVTLALRSSKESELQTSAALLASSRIESIRADGFFTDGEEKGDFGDEFPAFSYRQTISETSLEGLHEVTVAIDQASTREEIYELKTLLFKVPASAYDSTAEDEKKPGRKDRRGVERGGGR
jgi:general secretion pathway protein I